MIRSSVLSGVIGAGRLSRAGDHRCDPFAFRDHFEGYEDDRDLMTVWKSNSQVCLSASEKNPSQYVRCWVPEDYWGAVCMWIEPTPTRDLTGKHLAVTIRHSAGILFGAGHFYIEQGGRHYRSIAGCLLRKGIGRTTLRISRTAPRHFVGCKDKRRRPDLTHVSKVGVSFSVIASNDGGWVDVDYFAVRPRPSTARAIEASSLYLNRVILRRREPQRHTVSV